MRFKQRCELGCKLARARIPDLIHKDTETFLAGIPLGSGTRKNYLRYLMEIGNIIMHL